MNTRSFIVVDDVHLKSAESLQAICTGIDEAISEYISILNLVTTEAAKKGLTTERYKEYAGMIAALKGKFEQVGKSLNLSLKSFISEIDAADQYLY